MNPQVAWAIAQVIQPVACDGVCFPHYFWWFDYQYGMIQQALQSKPRPLR